MWNVVPNGWNERVAMVWNKRCKFNWGIKGYQIENELLLVTQTAFKLDYTIFRKVFWKLEESCRDQKPGICRVIYDNLISCFHGQRFGLASLHWNFEISKSRVRVLYFVFKETNWNYRYFKEVSNPLWELQVMIVFII